MEGLNDDDKYGEPSLISNFLLIGSYKNSKDQKMIEKYNIKGFSFH
jgi:hypothetical protein